MSVTPAELFKWAGDITAKGANADEVEMRAAISRAYYGVYFSVVQALESGGVTAFWGNHERIIQHLKMNAPSAVPTNYKQPVSFLAQKLDEMRVRRVLADYTLSAQKSEIVDALGLQVYDGRKIEPTAAALGLVIASSPLGKRPFPR